MVSCFLYMVLCCLSCFFFSVHLKGFCFVVIGFLSHLHRYVYFIYCFPFSVRCFKVFCYCTGVRQVPAPWTRAVPAPAVQQAAQTARRIKLGVGCGTFERIKDKVSVASCFISVQNVVIGFIFFFFIYVLLFLYFVMELVCSYISCALFIVICNWVMFLFYFTMFFQFFVLCFNIFPWW